MRKLLLLGVLTASLTGCSTIMGDDVDQKIQFQGGGERTFSIVKQAGDTKITREDVVSSIINGLEDASIYKMSERSIKYGSSGDRYEVFEGVDVKFSSKMPNHIKVTHQDNFGSLIDEQRAYYEFNIDDSGKEYMVTMKCPTEYHDIAKLRGGIGPKPVFKPGSAEKNFNAMCENAEPTLSKVIYVKGEIDTNYSSEDVFANFKRLLKTHSYSAIDVAAYDIEKAELFNLEAGDYRTKVAISVFPYRGGSKTLYSFKYTFSIDGKGKTTFSSQTIDALKQQINNVVND